VLRYFAAYCSVSLFGQFTLTSWSFLCHTWMSHGVHTHCNTLQHTATHCNTLQHTAKHCNTAPYPFSPLDHTTHHRTLQHTHCNTLQHTEHTATHCNTLQHTATHVNTRQHTSTHGNTLQHISIFILTPRPRLFRLRHSSGKISQKSVLHSLYITNVVAS